MIMEYGSLAYCVSLLFALLLLFSLFFAFRKSTVRKQRTTLFFLMLLNVAQHLLKSVLYPHLRGTGFTLVNTAYNVCAFLILASPVVLCIGSKAVKAFVSYAGTLASLLSLSAPFWFMGQTVLQWEFLRFYVCHVLLLLSSALPLLWKLHLPDYRDFWKTGFLFLGVLGAIVLNDVLFFLCDTGSDPHLLFDFLQAQNPFWMMHPTEVYPAIARILTFFTPAVFLPSAGHPYYTPLLWYAFPLYLAITALSFLLYFTADAKHFVSDCRAVAHAKKLQKKNTA